MGLTYSRFFVGSVFAVLVIVADFRLRDAEEIVAAELAGRASEVSAHLFGLI